MTGLAVFLARWSWVVVIAATLVIGGFMIRTISQFDDSTELAGGVAEMRSFQEDMFQLMIASSLLGEVSADSLHPIADEAEAHADQLIARVEAAALRDNLSDEAAAEIIGELQAVIRNLHAIAALDIGAPTAAGGIGGESNPLANLIAEQSALSSEGLDGFALNIVLGAVGYASLSASVTADIDHALEVLGRQNQSAVAELKQVGQNGIAFLLVAGVTSSGAFAWAGRRARHLAWDVERARELDEMKSEFVGLASHELRTPLTGILGFTELALDDETLSEETRGWLEHVHGESAHLAEIVGELLDLSRIESGRMELATDPVEVSEIIATVVARFVDRSAAERISVHGDFATISGDRGKLIEVFSNLVDNAIKYSPEGGSVRIVGGLGTDGMRVSITDSGMGIPADQVDLVFDRFHRVVRPEAAGIRSTGLGLYLVRELVILMGGDVTLRSKLGLGTTVTVRLPIPSVEASAAADPIAA